MPISLFGHRRAKPIAGGESWPNLIFSDHPSARGTAGGSWGPIRARTKAKWGKAINPHLFRDAAATTLSIVDPGHVRIAASVLGHRSFRTTEKYYNQAKGYQAQRSFHNVIAGIREGQDDAQR